MTSLSSIVLSASETASPTLMPAFLSSSAAALKRGFSFILEVSYTRIPKIQINPVEKGKNDMRTLARSYISLACFNASESWSFSTSPWSCLTLSCNSRFLRSSSRSTSTKVWNGDFGSSFSRLCEAWNERHPQDCEGGRWEMGIWSGNARDEPTRRCATTKRHRRRGSIFELVAEDNKLLSRSMTKHAESRQTIHTLRGDPTHLVDCLEGTYLGTTSMLAHTASSASSTLIESTSPLLVVPSMLLRSPSPLWWEEEPN